MEVINVKIDYNKRMQEIINSINSKTPTLLLHTCCAPCSSAVIERLSEFFSITVVYYNPNIEPKEEYEIRKEEQKRFIREYSTQNPVNFIDCDYENEKFVSIAKGLETVPEGGIRCSKCFQLRLEFVARLAKEKGYDFFGTSLTVSPYKNAQILNKIGEDLEQKYIVKFLYSDLKKQDGYKKSIQLSREYHLYRQDYCGCKFSKVERELQKRGRNQLSY